jgi:hypothetical protein
MTWLRTARGPGLAEMSETARRYLQPFEEPEPKPVNWVGMPSTFDESLLAVLERIATALETIAERERL